MKMKLETRIEKLEKLSSQTQQNKLTFADWTDKEIDQAIELLERKMATKKEQSWPAELDEKRKMTFSHLAPSPLTDEELDSHIARLSVKLEHTTP
jgi:lantibiotic modifying enzyme